MTTGNSIQRTPSAYGYPLLIKQLLHTPLASYADQEIVYRGTFRYTYRDFRQRVGQLASSLSSLGVNQGDTVAVMDWDSHRYLESYFAIPMMGAVLMTVNIRLSHEQILYTLNHSAAKVVLVHTDFIPVINAIRDKLVTVERFVLIGDGAANIDTANIPFAAEYEDLIARGNPDFEFPDFDENTRATTFYTTGTTGNPKGVYYSHRQLVLHTLAGMAAFGAAGANQSFVRKDVYMPITPMFHVHAWGFPYIATLMGVKQVYPGRYVPELLLDLIDKEKVTFSHGVPTIVHMLLNHPKTNEVSLKGLKVVVGGSALPRGLAKAAIGRGIDIFSGYGMSETGPMLCMAQLKAKDVEFADDEEQLTLRCKSGLPIPLVDLRIVDNNMNDLPHDGKAVGEIVVRAPWLTQGYLNNPDASEQLWTGGYLHTQDVANIDAGGYLQITDRTKDLVKSGGEWISTLEVESLISQHLTVSEVAVIGVKDEKWGESAIALVVAKPGQVVTEDDIVRHVREFEKAGRIKSYAVPKRVLIVAEIQKTSVGKTDKKVLRQKYADVLVKGAAVTTAQ